MEDESSWGREGERGGGERGREGKSERECQADIVGVVESSFKARATVTVSYRNTSNVHTHTHNHTRCAATVITTLQRRDNVVDQPTH